jgi:threonine dehydrogenase-like Zn-dependent dehydrogenase
MRAAAICAAGRARTVEAPLPVAGPGEALIRVEGCGVCGSSLPVFAGRPWFTYPLEPGAPGHEVWGSTEDGRRVAALSYHGFAQWDVAPESLLVELPPELDGLPFPGEALGCAVNVVRRARVRHGERVAIVGMGFVGTACRQLCRSAGAEVREFRRDTPGEGPYEVVIEATGVQSGLDTASSLVAEGGRLVIAGYHQDGMRTIDLQSWNWRAIEVVNAHERDPLVVVAGMRRAVELTLDGSLDVDALVTHTFGLDELEAAFRTASDRPPGFVKAVVCP